ncbi:MAG: hypothetical protein V4505_25705 [Pseudomonadota bacterium]
MYQKPRTLEEVQEALVAQKGQMFRISQDCNLSYDTVLRIRRGKTDPVYSTVVALHEKLLGPEKRD